MKIYTYIRGMKVRGSCDAAGCGSPLRRAYTVTGTVRVKNTSPPRVLNKERALKWVHKKKPAYLIRMYQVVTVTRTAARVKLTLKSKDYECDFNRGTALLGCIIKVPYQA